jgi:hypothetical protein
MASPFACLSVSLLPTSSCAWEVGLPRALALALTRGMGGVSGLHWNLEVHVVDKKSLCLSDSPFYTPMTRPSTFGDGHDQFFFQDAAASERDNRISPAETSIYQSFLAARPDPQQRVIFWLFCLYIIIILTLDCISF